MMAVLLALVIVVGLALIVLSVIEWCEDRARRRVDRVAAQVDGRSGGVW